MGSWSNFAWMCHPSIEHGPYIYNPIRTTGLRASSEFSHPPLGEEDEDGIASHEGTDSQQKPWQDWRVTCMAGLKGLCGRAWVASSTASATSSARRSQAFGPSWVRRLEPGQTSHASGFE